MRYIVVPRENRLGVLWYLYDTKVKALVPGGFRSHGKAYLKAVWMSGDEQ